MILSAAPALEPGTLLERSQSLLGLIAFTFLAFLVGRMRGARVFPLRVVLWGTALQFVFGAIVIFSPNLLEAVQYGIQRLLDFSNEGARLLFGSLIDWVVKVRDEQGNEIGSIVLAASFAFSVLPTIIFVSMLTAMLYHLGVLTWIVHALAWIMHKTTGTSGAETLSTAANIFVGQTEAPIVVRPFLPAATRSELMVIMVGGFANIASGVLVYYAILLKDFVRDVGGHLAAACFISAPATLVVSKLIMPETESPETRGGVKFTVERLDANLIDAATRGTSEGLKLAVNVGAMLIAFTALVALANALVGWGTGLLGLGTPSTSADGSISYSGWRIEQMLGAVLAPFAWLCGIPWQDAPKVGALLGMKTVLNEFIAYNEMSRQFRADSTYLSPRSALITVYALCGFANFASVGIQIGGISVLAPSRRHDLSRIGLLAMFGGALATLMAACVVGVLV
ncbi:MAG: NupC/NupG family nucleoside CNT transporter [Phycisphaerae bacterium]|nr:NupC/NupG family nucleoside CNT transporter [Phycisphaerae bacterium]MDW8261826.1 nucleoside transporter C-terminal domain-containing protein [Phycisphaerales bacterium]